MRTLAFKRGGNAFFVLGLGLWAVGSAITARGEDNTDYIFNGTTTNFGGALYIPMSSPGTNNSLQILNGGSVTNAGGGLGYNAGDNFNYGIISGPSSTWYNNGDFYFGSVGNNNSITLTSGGLWTNTGGLNIGYSGWSNQMVVSDGGQLYAGSVIYVGGYVGGYNSLLVTGTNSVIGAGVNFGVGNYGAYNQATIADGARVVSQNGYLGISVGTSSNNVLTVTGTGSVMTNTVDTYVGYAAPSNRLVIAAGGRIETLGVGYLGSYNRPNVNWIGNNNVAEVTGSNSLWNLAGELRVGQEGYGNQVLITNGGRVNVGTILYIGLDGAQGATNNSVLVTGSGARLQASSINVGYGSSYNSLIVSGSNALATATAVGVGNYAPNNQVLILDGGRLDTPNIYLGASVAAGSNAVLLVHGTGSVVSNSSGTYIGYVSPNARMTISGGGRVDSAYGYIGYYDSPGNSWLGDHGTAEVTGTGSTWNVVNSLTVGYLSHDSTLIVSNGGRVNVGGPITIGQNTGTATNSNVIVTGPGSILHGDSYITVGYNGVYSGGDNSHLLVTAGGTLEVNSLVGGTSASAGSISNVSGGIYQFTTASPFVTLYGPNTVMMSNAVVSYRGVVGADINNAQVGNIAKNGNNTFRLNNSTNATLASYTFNSVANTGNPTNYQRLALVNGGSRWQSTTLTIGSGGVLLVSNSASATVAGTVSNAGTISVVHSTMTFEGPVTISGSYRSDPSTNTFLADVTVSPGGVVQGGQGDLFDFKKSFYIHSTNNLGFQIGSSAVMFSGGGMHTNAITGQDFGTNQVGFLNNFAYGELHLGSASDQVCFECGNIPVVPSNGLYVGWLDLIGNVSLVTNLHAPNGINIYYDKTDVRNAYLGDSTFALTDCDFNPGGGFLIPVIPEPSALLLSVIAACAMLRRRKTVE